MEPRIYSNFGWVSYWYPNAVATLPNRLPSQMEEDAAADAVEHLRSFQELSTYQVCTHEIEIGEIEDFFLDDHSFAISYFLVGLFDWSPRKAAVPTSVIARIQGSTKKIVCLWLGSNSSDVSKSRKTENHHS
jgi:hypothetical protein